MAGAISLFGNVLFGLPSRANQINYDNTNSGLSATQVQAAIDELNGDLTDVKNPNVISQTVTVTPTTTGKIEFAEVSLPEPGLYLCVANLMIATADETIAYIVCEFNSAITPYSRSSVKVNGAYGVTVDLVVPFLATNNASFNIAGYAYTANITYTLTYCLIKIGDNIS